MKKAAIALIGLFLLILSACGTSEKSTADSSEKETKDTFTYESETGPIEVPSDPQRVVVLASYAGDVLSLGVNIVGVDEWAKSSPVLSDKLKDAETVSEDDVEKILELKPDLIIAADTTKNLDKFKEMAPTVTYTYNKVDYLTQHVEIGKLLNKGDEAQQWVDDFKERAKTTGDEIKAKIGEDATVTVMESYDKGMGVLGDSWGRGTEILYQEMGLAMPDKVKEMTEKEGYTMISSEVLPEYVGDYLVISEYSDQDNSYQDTELFKEIPAVKEGHVLTADANAFLFNDALTLDYQLDFFEEQLLK
ncbi:iron complex transport system substrate-binding protein [Terribacillus halophilus]|uniref:Iron complex transport system substrate-binding protein n=1 Tax=Terribacillus halophilus TaxID=361279 RepID=A0A1G6QE41_9BACI|nr:iron-hydroxamate ABC transporter substrate-binding protein [Terribacillus halophilus]SDC89947.1 iron complex transport system substrate-binding protein [Terribacillus halophilus]